MGKKEQRVTEYIEDSILFAKPILNHLRELIHNTCPEIEEAWKWSFPCFTYKGEIVCNIAAFKYHCAFGFWKASVMQDDDKILTTKEKSSMGNLGKIKSLTDLPDDAILVKYIQLAMTLVDNNVKLPPKNRPTEKQKQELHIPDYFIAELNKNAVAFEVFNNFPYSHKKEYVSWITEAKTETTRYKRIAQAIEMIEQKRDRNWKYKNC